MRDFRVIHEQGNYRIIERPDYDIDLDNLKGDNFNPKAHPNIDLDQLKADEKHFESLVYNEGVFGYELQVWNPEINGGWEHVDSCYGFVGQYTPTEDIFNHYIVDEMKGMIK